MSDALWRKSNQFRKSEAQEDCQPLLLNQHESSSDSILKSAPPLPSRIRASSSHETFQAKNKAPEYENIKENCESLVGPSNDTITSNSKRTVESTLIEIENVKNQASEAIWKLLNRGAPISDLVDKTSDLKDVSSLFKRKSVEVTPESVRNSNFKMNAFLVLMWVALGIITIGLGYRFIQWAFYPPVAYRPPPPSSAPPSTPPTAPPYYPSPSIPPIGNVPLTCWCSYAGYPSYPAPPPSNPPPNNPPPSSPPPSSPPNTPKPPSANVPAGLKTIIPQSQILEYFKVEWIPVDLKE